MIINFILLFVAVLAVSSAAIFAFLASAPGVVAAFWRLAISIPFIILIYRPKRLHVSKLPVLAGLALALHFSFWIESLFHASIAVSTTIVCTHSLFSGFFAYLWGEKPKSNQIFGVFVAMVGVYFLSGADARADFYGIALALAGAVAGGYYFASARFARDIDFHSYILLTYSSAAIFSLLACLLTSQPIFGYPLSTWIFLFLMALIPMLVGHTLLNYVLRHMEVLPVTASVIGEAVGATILATIFLGQTLEPTAYLYMLIILSGIAITFVNSFSSH
ncbi:MULTISPECIES: DMT family transporter [unclassified Archaeoglobus]|uniref:DMT family transporter n=1 Tax=unclassified Archaeoglobus TaxID=2643606 RepID=UPI0025BEDBFA|nr:MULTISPECIES: DMT family transporter [unclassified Archaeoglobus]